MAIVNPLSPPGFGLPGTLASDVGTNAQGLLKQKNPGVKKVAQTAGALGNDPNMALPGGGSLDTAGDTRFGGTGQNILQRLLAEETPSAELPLIQADQKNRQTLAGILGSAGALGAEGQSLQTQYGMKSMQNIQNLLESLGLSSGASMTGAGGMGLLGSLLGII